MSATGSLAPSSAEQCLRRSHPDIRAHLREQLQQAGARRIDADAAQQQTPRRRKTARDDEESRRGEIRRHLDVRAAQRLSALERDRAARRAAPRPRRPQHAFGVIAGRRRLADARCAGCAASRPADSADFTWALATGSRSRCRATTSALDPRPAGGPRASRFWRPSGAADGDALHRPAHERCIADQLRVERLAASSPMNRRIAVPAFPISSGAAARAQRRPRPATVHDHARRLRAARCARPARAAPQCRQAILALRETRDLACRPSARLPSMRARCEMDLSPGTAASPPMRLLGWAA